MMSGWVEGAGEKQRFNWELCQHEDKLTFFLINPGNGMKGPKWFRFPIYPS